MVDEFRYDPDRDPLIQRARSRGPRRHIIRGAVLLLILYLIFSRNRPIDMFLGEGAIEKETPTLTSGEAISDRPGEEGPYRFRWTPGRRYCFGMSWHVMSKGNPALEGSSGLDMRVDADLLAMAESVDADGAAQVTVDFGDVNMHGNHFGTPVDLRRRAGTTVSAAPQTVVAAPTAAGKKFEAPDISAFEGSISATVSPEGVAQGTADDEGVIENIALILRLAGTDFPQSWLQIGDTWETQFDVRFPGLGAKVPVKVTRVLSNEATYQGRRCAEIVSTIAPGEGRSSAVGKMLDRRGADVLAPKLLTNGQVVSYFDLDYGKVIHVEGDIAFDIDLQGGLKAASDMLGVYSGLLEEIEGGQSYDMNKGLEGSDEKLGLNLHVVAVLK